MINFEIIDKRKASLMRLDPDTASGFETWERAFLNDLEKRYGSLGVGTEILLQITLKDK